LSECARTRRSPIFLIWFFLIVLAAPPAQSSDTGNGKTAYEKHCASCHGKEGKGNPALGKLLHVEQGVLSLIEGGLLKQTTAEFIYQVEKGLPKMPAFKDKLSRAEIEDIAVYLSTSAQGSVPTTAELYKSKCSICHGPDGRGDRKMSGTIGVGSAALNLMDGETQAKSDETLTGAVRDGAKRMPAYKSRLSDEELKAMIDYLRLLSAEKPGGK
jgi:cytochrome c oxidase cbb3-type subunit 3